MTVNLDNIPQELRQIPQWVGWKYGPKRADGKRPKLPINPHTGRAAKPNDPATWADYSTAQAAVKSYTLEGVGFMFADGGGLVGVDFDDCIIKGVLAPAAAGVVRVLDSYAEISPSGLGVKVWVKATKPAGAGCRREAVLGCTRVEIYNGGRFFTVTGNVLPGAPATVEARQSELNDLCADLWPKNAAKIGPTVCQTVIPSSAVSQLGGDAVGRCWACILKMRTSESGNGGHDALLAAACTCFRFGLNVGQARGILERFNNERCQPAWNPAELDRKLSEGQKKVSAAGQCGELLHKGQTSIGKAKRWHNHLPQWILDIPTLRPYQRVVLQAIADRCDRKSIDTVGSLGNAIIGYRGLAKLCGMAERTAVRHVKRMQAMGMIVRVSKGGIRYDTGEVLANTYAIPGRLGALDGMTESHSVPSPQHWLTDDSVTICHTVGTDASEAEIDRTIAPQAMQGQGVNV